MILLEINAENVAASKFECDAPWPVDVDRVAGRMEALKGMEVEPWQWCQIVGLSYLLKNVEATQDAIMQPFIDP